MGSCIFCRIISGEIPCSRITETENFLVFLDISPCNKGHALIIPKKHYERFEEFPDEIGKDFGELQIRLTKAIMKVTDAEGCNLLLNNGKAAGQEVMHAHMHIQPRFSTDSFHYRWQHMSYDEREIDKYRKDIEKAL